MMININLIASRRAHRLRIAKLARFSAYGMIGLVVGVIMIYAWLSIAVTMVGGEIREVEAHLKSPQLLKALEVDNIDDILPIKHGGLVKSCLRTGTTLTEMRKVAGRTIVWSYRPSKKSRVVCIYGYDISDFLPLPNGSESLPEANPNPVLSTGPDGVPQFTNPATSQLLQELNVENVYDILPVDHKGLAKACQKTSTPLSKQRKVADRTIVWSYQPVDNR